MAAYSFQRRFVEPIQAGTKAHTIRGDRKDGRVPKVGEPLYLFCGMRTKGCFRILPEAPPCTRVERISIYYAHGPCVFVEAGELDKTECERLAVADGFDSFAEMMTFWEGRLPFTGNIIHWR